MSWEDIVKVEVPAGKAGDEPIKVDVPKKIVAGVIVIAGLKKLNLGQPQIAKMLFDLGFSREEIQQVGKLYRGTSGSEGQEKLQ